MNDKIDFAFVDSGTGGIPYMQELKKKLPVARCVYIGDTEHFPYGQKSAEEITSSVSSVIEKIIRRWNPIAIVIACNTISVTSLEQLRMKFPERPIVGTVPAIRLASRVSKNRCIGLLATNATVNHPYCDFLSKQYAGDCLIFKRGDPDLIAFIEHDLFTSTPEQRRQAVKPAVDYFVSNGCDTIILGCTHFTHVAQDIANLAGDGVQVVDSRDGVATQAIKVETEELAKNHEFAGVGELPADKAFFVTRIRSEQDSKEYETLCNYFSIPWGGLFE